MRDGSWPLVYAGRRVERLGRLMVRTLLGSGWPAAVRGGVEARAQSEANSLRRSKRAKRPWSRLRSTTAWTKSSTAEEATVPSLAPPSFEV